MPAFPHPRTLHLFRALLEVGETDWEGGMTITFYPGKSQRNNGEDYSIWLLRP